MPLVWLGRGDQYYLISIDILRRKSPLLTEMVEPYEGTLYHRIDLEHEDPDVIRCFANFLYEGEYDDDDLLIELSLTKRRQLWAEEVRKQVGTVTLRGTVLVPDGNEMSEFETHLDLMLDIRMHAFAVRYDVEGLGEYAARKFKTLIKDQWPLWDLSILITAIYGSTPGSELLLRECIVEVCAQHYDFCQQTQEIQDVANTNAEFREAVLNRRIKQLEEKTADLERSLREIFPTLDSINGVLQGWTGAGAALKWHCQMQIKRIFDIVKAALGRASEPEDGEK